MSDLAAEKHNAMQEEGGLSGFVILLIIVAVIITVSVVINLAYQKGMASARNELPRIAADPTPVKTKNDSIHKNSSNPEVYDRLEGVLPTRVVISADTASDPLEGFSQTISVARQSNQTTQNQDIMAIPLSDLENTPLPLTAERDPLSTLPPTTQRTTPDRGIQPEPTATLATKIPLPKTKPVSLNSVPPTTATGVTPNLRRQGTHLVQLASFRSATEAEKHFGTLGTTLGSIISSKTINIERADLDDKGVWYRLRVGPFPSKVAASSYCHSLKTRGQDCIVKAL